MGKGKRLIELAIGIFLKFPTPGKVKTRLGKKIGDEGAAKAYSAMVARVLKFAQELPTEKFKVVLFWDPQASVEQYKHWLPDLPFDWQVQQGESLGTRLHNAFTFLTETNPYAAVIGSDCIEITPAIFEKTRQSLIDGNQVVVGPTYDGGYYLIAMDNSYPFLFDHIDWSTSAVFDQTVERITRADLKHVSLDKLGDIDTWEQLMASKLDY